MSKPSEEKEVKQKPIEAEQEAEVPAEPKKKTAKAAKAKAPEIPVDQLDAAIESLSGEGVFPFKPDREKAKIMALFLAKQPKVSTYIPLGEGEKLGQAVRTFTRNGFVISVVKGVYVSLPKSLHDEMVEADRATKKAESPKVAITDPITKRTRLVEVNLANLGDKDREFLGE